MKKRRYFANFLTNTGASFVRDLEDTDKQSLRGFITREAARAITDDDGYAHFAVYHIVGEDSHGNAICEYDCRGMTRKGGRAFCIDKTPERF